MLPDTRNQMLAKTLMRPNQLCKSFATAKARRSIGKLNLAPRLDWCMAQVRFNHDSQLLAFASRDKKDSLRVVRGAGGLHASPCHTNSPIMCLLVVIEPLAFAHVRWPVQRVI